jgi:hypothetical protein
MIEMPRGQRSLAIAAMTVALLLPLAAESADYHGRRAWTLRNDRISVVVTPGGGHIASLMLNSGPGANLNPLWLPPWPSVEPGAWTQAGDKYGDKPGAQLVSCILGHNLCLDFFGAPSDAETKAGIPVHGEAPCINWTSSARSNDKIVYGTTLPIAQMKVTRTISLTPGSSAIWITEKVDNLSAMDRPFGWQQHVTIGPPFLQEGATKYDMSAGWGMVDKKEFSKGQRLKQGGEFEWPNAPGANGETVDLREYPGTAKNSDFTVCRMDPSRSWVYFTAINPKKRLLVGYIWPGKIWPWAANWEENHFRTGHPWNGKGLARGIEFGTSPFAYSKRDTIAMGSLHNTPTYRWIGARGTQSVSYAAFVAPIPASATGVKDVKMGARSIEIILDGVEHSIKLPLRR